jgi:succinate dehydrogenase / fumarate reductase flavoprotein subunit
MPVKPGQHYAMGGIETNEFGETAIGGLYAAGECACASVHGANRLGGNALPELIVFGKRAGRHAAGEEMGEAEISTGKEGEWEPADYEFGIEVGEAGGQGPAAADGGAVARDPNSVLKAEVKRAKARVDELLARKGRNHAEIRSAVQETMTANVNVFREEGRLEETLGDLREAREAYKSVAVSDPSRTFNTDLIHTMETRNILDIAEALTMGALAREEFRGAHWRKQHQERKDESWLKHTLVSWNDGEPELWYKPTILEGENKTYEPKSRSY